MGRRTDEREPPAPRESLPKVDADENIGRLAMSFFQACTKVSESDEDILPQEDSDDMKMSVFAAFAELFPESIGDDGHAGKIKRMRLHFNQIGYQIYGKEQSRRVPAVRAKPGNPGYGFRRAKWRDTMQNPEDARHCEQVLRAVGCESQRIDLVKKRIQALRETWDAIRRPSRPAGPGRPRRPAPGGSSGQSSSKKENGLMEQKPAKHGASSAVPMKEKQQLTKPSRMVSGSSGSMSTSSASYRTRGSKRSRDDDAYDPGTDDTVVKSQRIIGHRTRPIPPGGPGSEDEEGDHHKIQLVKPEPPTLPPISQLVPGCAPPEELGDLGTEGMGALELFATVAAAVWSANRVR